MTLSINASALDRLLRSVLPAMSRDTTREHLHAVFFTQSKRRDYFDLFATDGHRIHVARFPTTDANFAPFALTGPDALALVKHLRSIPTKQRNVIGVELTAKGFSVNGASVTFAQPCDVEPVPHYNVIADIRRGKDEPTTPRVCVEPRYMAEAVEACAVYRDGERGGATIVFPKHELDAFHVDDIHGGAIDTFGFRATVMPMRA